MNKKIKQALAAAGIVAGLAALTGCGAKSEATETLWPITDSFENIRIEAAVSDIQFTPSADSSCSVVWLCDDRIGQSVRVEDNTLVIQESSEKLLLNLDQTPKITIQLPQPEYQDLTITGDTGNIDTTNYFTFRNVDIETDTGDIGCRCNVLGDFSAESDTGTILLGAGKPRSVDMSTNTGTITLQAVITQGDLEADSDVGQIYLSYVKAANARVETNVGAVTLDNVLIDAHLDISTDTGSVELRDADAGTVEIDTVTGDIAGNLLTDKTFHANSGTGSVSVPDTTGGECSLNSDTGDIAITVGGTE